MFDVLQNDEPEEEEVEEEEVAVDQVIEYVPPFYLYSNECSWLGARTMRPAPYRSRLGRD